jgi:hypothetical protein
VEVVEVGCLVGFVWVVVGILEWRAEIGFWLKKMGVLTPIG